MPSKIKAIRLHGVRQNNLKNLDIDIPLGKLSVVTGLSGTGKSSLVFDTLHAEGQRRYVETFNAYTRQFLEMLPRPEVDRVDHICPSIAIEQRNSVRTSRSTVGTMTELCDFFKVWFAGTAKLFDPVNGEPVTCDTAPSIWKTLTGKDSASEAFAVCFAIDPPPNLELRQVISPLASRGYTRAFHQGKRVRLDADLQLPEDGERRLLVVQDRMKPTPGNRKRFFEAADTAFEFGRGSLYILGEDGSELGVFHRDLRSRATGRVFREPTPSLFSYNSPIGACPSCRGFGRVIGLNEGLVIPDENLSLNEGAIRVFQGKVYQNSLEDLRRHAASNGLRMNVPWRELSDKEKRFVWEGAPDYPEEDEEDAWMDQWYGIRRFFSWLERNSYKMHVRVFLSKYRSYDRCPECGGQRLREEARNWKWEGHTLPELYALQVGELLAFLRERSAPTSNPQAESAREAILQRLGYLEEVGLGYLTLDRQTRTLSGGETERVNLTTCLGTSMVDTLFVLDEPSVGLHPRDIDRLIDILRHLTSQGNTVVVVEHDERIMRAADHLFELGPEPGARGGHLVFTGTPAQIMRATGSLTGDYLSGKRSPLGEPRRRPVKKRGKAADKPNWLSVYGASKHNIRDLDLHLPLGRLVCLSGVSGSGKSTLLNQVLYQNLCRHKGQSAEDPATITDLDASGPLGEVLFIDQSGLSRTPRSNPAVLTGAWEEIRKLYAATEEARSSGMTPGTFSFNSGEGRCEHCQGLGYEKVEMQFLSDLYVPCPVCDGRRFKPTTLAIRHNGKSIDELLRMDVHEALLFFGDHPRIRERLEPVADVGLGYLSLGQPLNTLSGGESQRLKLIRHLTRSGQREAPALLLIDEPTTGLHRHDIGNLLRVFQQLVDRGHSLVVVEHHPDILEAADWLIELGPDAGSRGGRIVAQGTPQEVHRSQSPSSDYLFAAESPAPYRARPRGDNNRPAAIEITGARENNLQNLSLRIPHDKITVLSGVSGSGKSTLAFNIVFAEGQRRFMESMSPYARQFAEQLPKPVVEGIRGLAPSVAIEQRVTRGTAKSTVATITEVAQYLRLLYARIGIQHNPATGNPVRAFTDAELQREFQRALEKSVRPKAATRYLAAPLVRGRKGHYQPLADWVSDHGYPALICDGRWVNIADFQKLDRYREHDIDLILGPIGARSSNDTPPLKEALRLGKGSALLVDASGRILSRFSRSRVDPETGEGFSDLEPKHFSWNSPRGWCPTCRGRGTIQPDEADDEVTCPECGGTRLSATSRSVFLRTRNGESWNLPNLLALHAPALRKVMSRLKLEGRDQRILDEILPEIEERLKFMERIGLEYLTFDRATRTLSGGEAQRIRLASQLGSNLTGVLYVLDEPTIGLHARDNQRLIESIRTLRDRGNTVLIVEHDEDVLRNADRIVDIGPGAGAHGGRIIAEGSPAFILRSRKSPTGNMLREPLQHPLRGKRRPLPKKWDNRRKAAQPDWIALEGVRLRNWKGDTALFPRRRLIGVCGVSGAGKSTLVCEGLARSVSAGLRAGSPSIAGRRIWPSANGTAPQPPLDKASGYKGMRKVVEMDQSPIGKTSRSTPATYIGVFDRIREAFAQLPEAKMRGYNSGTFSFNTSGGRCEHCKGAGRVKLEMNFLPDTYLECEACGGKRYRQDLLELHWREHSIADILDLTFEEAAAFFAFDSRIRRMLDLMVETGLGYLKLGQSSPTLSGGEAQRLKLVSELIQGLETAAGRMENLYILEEPTIGLHLSDCRKLLLVLHRLVDEGHTVVVIEHHPDILAEADYLIEIGPDGGDRGGRILHQGTPEALLKKKKSPTSPFLH